MNQPSVLTSPPPSAPQHAAVLVSPTHRQTLHQEEGKHGDSQLPESCHEGAAEQVMTEFTTGYIYMCRVCFHIHAERREFLCAHCKSQINKMILLI